MRGTTIASAGIHIGLVAALFLVRTPATIIVPGPEVVQVSLLDSPQMPMITQPAPQPVKAPEPEQLKPTEDAGGVRLEKPKPVKQNEPRQEQPPQPATPTPALPYASVGSSGLQGAIALDSNFEFTYYLTLVRNRIAQSWSPPAGLAGGQPVRAVTYFRVARDGSITSIRLETGSGVEFFDRSALRAVQLSDPLPPLPLGYSGGDLGVHFGFQFQAP